MTDGASDEALIVCSADHGELLGAHGGLHQKWFNLYDEATRVPFTIVRIGERPTGPRVIDDMPTSHVDLVPTLLAAANIDAVAVHDDLSRSFSEVHPLPGRNLMTFVDGAASDRTRTVFLMTRDNILEGDTGASAVARDLGLGAEPPENMRIEVPADVGANFEAIVTTVDGHLWKLVRTFDDPATWTEPNVRHLAATPGGHPTYRSVPLDDEWEMYDLTADPIEAVNLWLSTTHSITREVLTERLTAERRRNIHTRNRPWPYTTRCRQST